MKLNQWQNILYVIVNANCTTWNSNKIWHNKTCQSKCKNYLKCNFQLLEDYNWNPSTYICEKSKYFKSIANTSVTNCDEVIVVMENLSTKKANVMSTAPTNCPSRKVRNFQILHTVLLVIILLLIITIFRYHYGKQNELMH